MAPALATYARSMLTHALTTREPDNDGFTSLGPREAHNRLLARDTTSTNRPNPESGILHPGDINNKFIFVLFGLLGVGIVCTGIWFFFWAKNGGFYFKKDDWDDYKSTVLRRKGPNGTTLSGATTETDLGGGSVYKDIDEGTEITGITGGVSDIVGREKRRRRREQKEREKEREKERRREEKRRAKDEKKASRSRDSKAADAAAAAASSKRKVGDDGAVIDEDAEAEAAEYLRNYRHERPARVGGLNRESDASTWDGSTNPSESSHGGGSGIGYTESTVTSELITNRERTPTSSPASKKKTSGGGIRKVYSTADKRDSRETERIRAEARKLQEKGRAATAAASSSGGGGGHRRNFSWQRDNQIDEDTAMMAAPPSYTASEVETRIPGSWAESDVGSEVGTKAYYHVIPGLSSSGGGSSTAGTDVRDYAEERRKNRRSGGYRRAR